MIGAAIREHDTNLGETRVSIDFGPSGDPRIACIKRRAADLIDANETIGGENSSSKIARFRALAMTDIEASVMWAAKAATQSGCRATRFVTCRQVAPSPRAEAPLATPAARLDGCLPRDPNSRHRRLVAWAETTLSTSSPPPALRQRLQRPHGTPSSDPCRALPRLHGATRASESHPARPRLRSPHPAPCDHCAITAPEPPAGRDDASTARRAPERDARSTADGLMHTLARHAPAMRPARTAPRRSAARPPTSCARAQT